MANPPNFVSTWHGCSVLIDCEWTMGLTMPIRYTQEAQRIVYVFADHLPPHFRQAHPEMGSVACFGFPPHSDRVNVNRRRDQVWATHLGMMLEYVASLNGDLAPAPDCALRMTPTVFRLFVLNYNGYPALDNVMPRPAITVMDSPEPGYLTIGGARWGGVDDKMVNRAEVTVFRPAGINRAVAGDEKVILRHDWKIIHNGKVVRR